MRIISNYLICVALFALIICGCSSGHQPVTPDSLNQDNANVAITINSMPVFVSDISLDGSPLEGMGALGVFQLEINPSDNSAELISLRQSALTDVLEVVDITNFLQLAPCTDCVKIQSISLDIDGNIVVSIGIKHPFGAGDPLKPPSGKNRADLHVFNVEGIVVSDAPATQFGLLNQSTAGFELINADGYTGYLDAVLDDIFPTDATVHPYITHFDDYSAGNFDPSNTMGFESVTDPPPSGNLVMAMGCDYDYQDYVFNLSGEPTSFIYAVGCTYAVSAASKQDRFTPEFRIPQHNKKAASEVSLHIITNNLAGEDMLSTAAIEVHVVDISHGVAAGEGLNEMFADSSVDDIFIDIPSVMTSMLILDGNNPASGTGHDPSDPLVYEGTITNTAGATEGTYAGLIKVSDTYTPGLNTSSLLNNMDGIKRVEPIQNPLEGLFAISEFATYQTFSIYVMTGNDPPVAVLETDPDPPLITQYMTIDLIATSSYDSDGTVDLYEYDFDWDGVPANFTADDSNTTGLITSESYDTEGFYTIGLRVTDNELAVGYDSVELEVEAGCVIFVDDDNTAGPWDGSPANPYQYVQDGVDAAIDDCIVWIKPGRYNEDLGGGTGSNLAEVTINDLTNLTLHGEDYPVINVHRYYGPPWPSGIRATNCNGLTVEGIELSLNYHNNSYIRLSGCNNATIQDCKGYPSSDLPSGGAHSFINATSCGNLTIKEITYVDTSNSSTSSNHLGYFNACNNLVITLNTVTNNANGTNIYHTFTKWLALYNCNTVEISKNKLGHHHKTASASDYQDLRGIRISGGSGFTIRNNLIYDLYFHNSNTSAESRNVAIDVTNSTNIEIYNNTIDSFGPNNASGLGYTMCILLDSACSNPTIHSNIISNIYANGGSTAYGVSSAVAVDVKYSDVWNVSGGTSYRYYNLASEGTGSINSDPMFTNPGAFDYTLQPGSPCEGTGLNGDDMGCYGGSDPLP